jgi:xylulose-5-phosphate/fructose-6-phosphate phosphoketolase
MIFAYHGYPWLIHRLTYRRPTTETSTCAATRRKGRPPRPSTWWCSTDLDRFHLAIDVINRVPSLGSTCATLRQAMVDKRIAAREYTREFGDDIPEVKDWVWPDARGLDTAAGVGSDTGGDNE